MFDQLTLHNFKAFRDLTIPLKPLTLLSGLNGSGKSTTLQALALLRQSWETRFLHNHGLLLNGDLIEIGAGVDVLHNAHEDDKIAIELGAKHLRYRFEVIYKNSGDVLHFCPQPSFSVDALQQQDGGLFGHNFQYLRADRASPSVSFPKAYHLVSERRFLGSCGQYTAHFLSLFQDEEVDEQTRHPKDKSPSLLSQVNAWMRDLSPGVNLNVDDIPRTDSVRLNYFYGRSAGIDSSGQYRSTNVGFGLTYVLPVIVACLMSPKNSWLLIENPEAHLHPQGQALIGNLLALTASRGVKILVESHSDHILNGIRLSVKNGSISSDKIGLNFFSRSITDTQPIRISPSVTDEGRISAWPDGFFDQWDKSLDELLG